MTWLLAHLSDLHLSTPDTTIGAVFRTRERFAQAVLRLRELHPSPDLVVVTGDLVERATDEEYGLLGELLAGSGLRWVLVGGNHDRPDALAALGAIGGVEVVVGDGVVEPEVGPRVVVLDTTVPGHHHGEVDEAQADWLDAVLAAAPDRETVLAMHHPPLDTGMWWMDYGGTRGRERVRAVVARHPQVLRVLAGHVHRPLQVSWGPTVVSVAPSLTYRAGAALGSEAPAVGHDDPIGLPLHHWDGEVLLSTEVALEEPPASFAFADVIPGWDEYEARARTGQPMPKGTTGH